VGSKEKKEQKLSKSEEKEKSMKNLSHKKEAKNEGNTNKRRMTDKDAGIDKRQGLVPSKNGSHRKELKPSGNEQQKLSAKKSTTAVKNNPKWNDNGSIGTSHIKHQPSEANEDCVLNQTSVATKNTKEENENNDTLVKNEAECSGPMLENISNVNEASSKKGAHFKTNTMDDIRCQMSALRAEQDVFRMAFEETINQLQTQDDEQSLLDSKEEETLIDGKVFNLEKYNFNSIDGIKEEREEENDQIQ